ncbi:hypothetical protein Q3G72_020542 [Acer saccharum]|nr:hypothetical protein Q3G72_020542 [Acer saccharum]
MRLSLAFHLPRWYNRYGKIHHHHTPLTVMIITPFFPPIYYIFQCDSHWHFIYLGGITAMGIFTIITLLSPSLSTSKFRTFQALLFSSMGFFGIVPAAVHGSFVN